MQQQQLTLVVCYLIDKVGSRKPEDFFSEDHQNNKTTTAAENQHVEKHVIAVDCAATWGAGDKTRGRIAAKYSRCSQSWICHGSIRFGSQFALFSGVCVTKRFTVLVGLCLNFSFFSLLFSFQVPVATAAAVMGLCRMCYHLYHHHPHYLNLSKSCSAASI